MSIKTIKQEKYIGDELKVDMEIDHIDGEYLDTRMTLDGEWWVGGSMREEFCQKLEALIDEYRI